MNNNPLCPIKFHHNGGIVLIDNNHSAGARSLFALCVCVYTSLIRGGFPYVLLLCCHVEYCEWSVKECVSIVRHIFSHPIGTYSKIYLKVLNQHRNYLQLFLR